MNLEALARKTAKRILDNYGYGQNEFGKNEDDEMFHSTQWILDLLNEAVKEKDDRPKIVCFCGSSRFVAQMAVLMWEYEKQGIIAMGLHLLPDEAVKRPDGSIIEHHLAEEQGVAPKMDELHLRKIDLADEVFVVNIDGYIGDSTRNEIAYATKVHKPVIYLESIDKE